MCLRQSLISELETQNVIKAIDNFISKNGDADISEKIISDRANKNSKTGTAKGYLNFIKNTSIYDDLLNDDIFKKANDQLINSLKQLLPLNNITATHFRYVAVIYDFNSVWNTGGKLILPPKRQASECPQ